MTFKELASDLKHFREVTQAGRQGAA